VETRKINIARPMTVKSISLKRSGFINSSRRICKLRTHHLSAPCLARSGESGNLHDENSGKAAWHTPRHPRQVYDFRGDSADFNK
jgi:hypothetical protein